MNKLAAFTITELIVVSLLGTVCAAAAFTGLQVIQEQFFSYEKETSRVLEVGELQRQLQSDVLAANEIFRTERGIGLSLPRYEVYYSMEEQGLQRIVQLEDVRKKTFPLKVKSIQSHLKGLPVDQGQVDFFTLHVECDAAFFSLTFEKNYSASDKMTSKIWQ